jgi:hypothetical protein
LSKVNEADPEVAVWKVLSPSTPARVPGVSRSSPVCSAASLRLDASANSGSFTIFTVP